MKFHYHAINLAEERIEGERESADKISLYHELKTEGINLIYTKEIKPKKQFLSNIKIFSGVKMHEKIIFTRNLASMLEAGLALSRAFTILDKQTKNKYFKGVIKKLSEDIKTGKTLHDSLKGYPKIFSSLFVSMVGAGEESGKLADSLNIVASQMEKTHTLQKKIKGALMYPSVIVFAMVVIGGFMLVYIVPNLSRTFKEIGVELPAATKFIILISDTLKNHFISLFSVITILVIIGVIFARTSKGKRVLEYTFLHVPVIATLIKETVSARTTRTLSSLLSSGVPVTNALRIVQDVIQNSHYKEVLEKAEKNIQMGSPMSAVFIEHTHLYPVFVGEMMAVGEETGDIVGMLLKIALYYEEDVEQKTKDMSTIIEPVLMLVVGVAVGFFAISMISPMYSLVENL